MSKPEHKELWDAITAIEERLGGLQKHFISQTTDLDRALVRVRALEAQVSQLMGLPEGYKWTITVGDNLAEGVPEGIEDEESVTQ